eukprot:Em0019g1106a
MATRAASGLSQEIIIPHDQHGNVDWDALGRMSVEHILHEVTKVEVAERRHQNGETDGVETENDWRYAYEKHNIVVFSKKLRGSPIKCFLGRGVVDAPVRAVGDFTGELQSTFTWDNTLVGVRCVKVIQKSTNCADYIWYQLYESTNCLIKTRRDNLFFVRCIYADGKYVQSAISVEHPDCPTLPAIKRIRVYSGSGWVMEPYLGSDKKTLVTYLAHLDPIELPAIISNRLIGRHPLAIHYLRLHLTHRPVVSSRPAPSTTEHSNGEVEVKLQSFEESSSCSEFIGDKYL